MRRIYGAVCRKDTTPGRSSTTCSILVKSFVPRVPDSGIQAKDLCVFRHSPIEKTSKRH